MSAQVSCTQEVETTKSKMTLMMKLVVLLKSKSPSRKALHNRLAHGNQIETHELVCVVRLDLSKQSSINQKRYSGNLHPRISKEFSTNILSKISLVKSIKTSCSLMNKDK